MTIHNQGKQSLKRIRRKLGLIVNREPLYFPDGISIRVIRNGITSIVSAKTINDNPKQWGKYVRDIVVNDPE